MKRAELIALAERVEAGEDSDSLDIALAEASMNFGIPVKDYGDGDDWPVNYDPPLWVIRHGRPDISAAALRARAAMMGED